jgi:hypothetical protein
MGWLTWLFAAILIANGWALHGQAQEVPEIARTNLPLKRLGPGLFELGRVRFNKEERTVRFPAQINQTDGPIEYLIVTGYGKTHESLLRTAAEPYHIQLALLLLGGDSAGTNAFPNDATAPLPGEPVRIELNWRIDGKEKQAPAEQFVYNLQTKKMMSQGEWVYTGSRVVGGSFVAQQDGSIASIMLDPDAMINNPRPGRENDKIWQVLSNGLPAINSPVEVIIRLKPPNSHITPAQRKDPAQL